MFIHDDDQSLLPGHMDCLYKFSSSLSKILDIRMSKEKSSSMNVIGKEFLLIESDKSIPAKSC